MERSLLTDIKLFLDKLEEGIIESENGGKILYANPSAILLLGLAEKSLESINIAQFINHQIIKEKIFKYNNRMLLIKTIPMHGEDSSSIIITIVDISDRIQKQKFFSLLQNLDHEINNPNQFILSAVTRVQDMWKSIVPVLDEYMLINSDLSIGGVSYSKNRKIVEDHLSRIMEGAERIDRVINSNNSLLCKLQNENREDPGSQKDLEF